MKILLVEDHPGVAEISCRILRDLHGHEVELAMTGKAALEAANAAVPDLVLIDLNLPDISGYEVARRLRTDTAFDHTVLVAVTGFGSFVDDDHAKKMGIDAHFRKPMDFDLLEDLKRME
jgi:CheY-like chemotaxis protein